MRVLKYIGVAATALLATAACQKDPASPAAADSDAASPAVTQMPITAAGAKKKSNAESTSGALRAYVWSCADGQKIVMRNLTRERAIAMDLHDGTRRLEQAVSASGLRYEDASVSFWTKGSAATLARKGMPTVQCTEIREESLRESARLAGAR